MLEKAINEESFDLLELSEQVVEFFVVVFFNAVNFFAHGSKFGDLIFNFVLELGDFSL